MKSAKLWFESLPTLIEVRALNSCIRPDNKYSSLSQAIKQSISWPLSDEGEGFWLFIYNSVKAMEMLMEQEQRDKDTENTLAKMNQDFIKNNFKDGELI